MSERPLGLQVTRGFARLLLCAYPARFRRTHRRGFLEIAGHLWSREVEARRPPVRATFAVSGVYGIVSLDVSRRRREVGLRMALGATAAQVIANLVRRGLRPVLVGSALGVGAAMGLGPFLEDLLFRVPARDPFSAAAGVALVVAAAALGGVLPARRAAHVDPAITLRAE